MARTYWTLALFCIVVCARAAEVIEANATDTDSAVGMFVQNAEHELNKDMMRRIIGGINLMADASQSIFEWCRSVKPLHKAPVVEDPAADNHFMKHLDDGNGKMNLAQIELRMSLIIFNTVTVKFILLQQQFENEHQRESDESVSSQNAIADFKEKLTSTQEFYKNLKAKADEMFLDISELKATIGEINMTVTTDEDSKPDSELTESLIAKCNEIINE